METANSFTFFASYYEALQYLSDEYCGVMFKAICEFALKGNEPELTDPILKGYWTLIRPTLERSIKRAEAGRRGGQGGAGVSRNGGNSHASKSIATQNDINTEKERKGEEKEEGEGTDLEKERNGKKQRGARFVPPTVEEVKAYCLERGNGIDAQHFVDFYESRGWKYNNTSIRDWKACVRTWEQKRGFKPAKSGAKQPQLGVGEFIDSEGNRRYGSGNLPPVPMDAPPRPDNESIYSAETNTWIPAGL